jgi:hypothetical protein
MNERFALLTLEEYKETLERLQRLEALCARAADALEVDEMSWDDYDKLVTELRKAAE